MAFQRQQFKVNMKKTASFYKLTFNLVNLIQDY